MFVMFLGGVGTVTGSKYLLDLGDSSALVAHHGEVWLGMETSARLPDLFTDFGKHERLDDDLRGQEPRRCERHARSMPGEGS